MNEIRDAPLDVDQPAYPPMCTVLVGKLTASFETNWGNLETKKPPTQFELTYDGKHLELDDLNVTAGMGQRRGMAFWRRRKQVPNLYLVGRRPDDDALVKISIGVHPDEFGPTNQSGVPVQGRLSFGEDSEYGWGRCRMLAGTLMLDDAGRENASPVSGRLEMQIYEMRGRRFGRR